MSVRVALIVAQPFRAAWAAVGRPEGLRYQAAASVHARTHYPPLSAGSTPVVIASIPPIRRAVS